MASYKYERLSAQDQSFLVLETGHLRMHVSSTQIFELGPLRTESDGVDFDSIKRFIGSVLHRIPRYRQKLAWIPLVDRAVWIDDPDFDLDYHIRHTALPRPGTDDQLKRLASRVMAQQLDRDRSLWEIWVVEGLDEDRFALISKIHHCMIDGSSGVDISQILQSPSRDREIHEAPRYLPREAPTPQELLADAVRDRLLLPGRILRGARSFRRETEDLRAELGIRARAIREVLGWTTSRASDTPINGPIGPHRHFDWLTVPLADLKAIRHELDCTINDVVLTILTGAFRDYLSRRGLRVEELDFRVQTPVSVRREEEKGKLGNRVSTWSVRLPLDQADPRRQVEAIRKRTRDLKESRQALGADMMMAVMDVMPTSLMSLGVQAASGSMNTIVTNVPGPQFPLYLLGAPMKGLYPQVPLLPNVGLGIALISYDGRVCWGFNADPGLVPDLEGFVSMVASSCDALRSLARTGEPTGPKRAKPRSARVSASPPAR